MKGGNVSLLKNGTNKTFMQQTECSVSSMVFVHPRSDLGSLTNKIFQNQASIFI